VAALGRTLPSVPDPYPPPLSPRGYLFRPAPPVPFLPSLYDTPSPTSALAPRQSSSVFFKNPPAPAFPPLATPKLSLHLTSGTPSKRSPHFPSWVPNVVTSIRGNALGNKFDHTLADTTALQNSPTLVLCFFWSPSAYRRSWGFFHDRGAPSRSGPGSPSFRPFLARIVAFLKHGSFLTGRQSNPPSGHPLIFLILFSFGRPPVFFIAFFRGNQVLPSR